MFNVTLKTYFETLQKKAIRHSFNTTFTALLLPFCLSDYFLNPLNELNGIMNTILYIFYIPYSSSLYFNVMDVFLYVYEIQKSI